MRPIREDLNPQGLEIQVFPNLWEIKNTFKKQWETNLQECTKNMMNSLIEYYNQEIKELDNEIIEF